MSRSAPSPSLRSANQPRDRQPGPRHGTEEEAGGGLPDIPTQDWNAASIRRSLDSAYRNFAQARISLDGEAIGNFLAAEFYVQLASQRLSRQEFIDQVTQPNSSVRLTRYDAQILSVQKTSDGWSVVITEKMEWERASDVGNSPRTYSLWVTRDSWRREGDRWMATFSEEIGHQDWVDNRPPFEDW